jgi:hypothetical protein
MATYNSLTQEQKNILGALATQTRAFAGVLARANTIAEVLVDDWNAQVSAIVSSLDPGEVIPNTSGLAGAASVTKEEIVNLFDTSLTNLLATYNTATARQLYVKLAGPSNVIND